MTDTTHTTLSPIETIQAIYEAFGRGDIAGVLDRIDDQVDWSSDIHHSVPDHDIVPVRRHGIGKGAAVAYFQAVGTDFEFHSFVPHVLATAGDEVFARISVDMTVRPTGKRIAFDEIHHFVVRDGLIVQFRGYFDTAMFIEAYRP